MKEEKLLYADETHAIRGAAFEVYKEMGNAFVHRAQLLNYLRITGCRLGLLITFGTYPKVSIERFVL